MRPILRPAMLAATCVAALALAGCGRHVASNAPITYAPADTPYLLANFKPASAAVVKAWLPANGGDIQVQLQSMDDMVKVLAPKNTDAAAVLDAIHAELADVHSRDALASRTGMSWPALYAVYGIGDVPVGRMELASADTFKSFWARVEKRAGITAPTASVDKQAYWSIGGADAKLRVLVAIEGKQLVVTVAPAHASPDLLPRLLGLTHPAKNAVDRLADINGQHGYGEIGSGYVDLPKLVANLFDGTRATTRTFADALGGSLADPACNREFGALARQVPLITGGFRSYTAKESKVSVDIQLSASLLGALTALKQPVPGMGATPDKSMFDLVLALPLAKWQAFVRGRAEAAAQTHYQCPALDPLNRFAKTAANPPVHMPPEAASILGARVVLDRWEAGPQIAGRVLVASSDPAALAKEIQQTLPQFALKTIPSDGKPVEFELPPKLAAMLGSGNQAWIAADAHAIVAGAGAGEEANVAKALDGPSGNGDRLLRMHLDGTMYGIFGSWMNRIAAMLPARNQTRLQRQTAAFSDMSRIVATQDMDVKLDAKGLHLDATITHR